MRKGFYLIAGLLLIGFVALGFLQFKTKPSPVHYHANYAIFVDGQKLDLSGDFFMEDVIDCIVEHRIVFAEDRAHQHANDGEVAHVHHEGVTWGHFMANLGINFGDDFLVTEQGHFQNDETKTLTFILNGRPHPSPHNHLIQSEDRLLISFGEAGKDVLLQTQYPQVATTAAEYNGKEDPANCSGNSA